MKTNTKVEFTKEQLTELKNCISLLERYFKRHNIYTKDKHKEIFNMISKPLILITILNEDTNYVRANTNYISLILLGKNINNCIVREATVPYFIPPYNNIIIIINLLHKLRDLRLFNIIHILYIIANDKNN
jgi:hypothetical protein